MKNLVLLLICLVPLSLFAGEPQTAADVTEGVHYAELFPDQEAGKQDKIQVQEFFWYGCPHCYHFEPHVEPWVKKKAEEGVEFVRVPVIFNRAAELHAEMYYALQLMGVLTDELHAQLFDAIQNRATRRDMVTQAGIENFLKDKGIDVATFRKTINSFAVKTKVRRAANLAKRYGINGVPSMVIDGAYRTGSGVAGMNGMLVVADKLIDQIKKERGE